MASRAPRPTTSYFSVSDLKAAWKSDAEFKNPGFRWDGSDYTKGRAGAPDKAGLVKHSRPLAALLKLAPSGFPSHGLVRQTLMDLHSSDKIFVDVGVDRAWKVASDAADVWRVMCKHVYNVAKTPNVPDDLKDLAGLIRTSQPSQSPAPPAAPAPAAPALQPHGAEFPDFDGDLEQDDAHGDNDAEDSVEFISEKCMCPDCVAARGPVVIEEDAPEAQAGGAPQEDIEIPDCSRGGQRKQTVSKRLRIRGKTAPVVNKAQQGSSSSRLGRGTAGKPMKAMKAKKTKNAAVATAAINLPVSMVSRASKPGRLGEAYVMHRTASGYKYVAGQVESQSASYYQNVKALMAELKNGAITTIQDAKAFLASRVNPQ